MDRNVNQEKKCVREEEPVGMPGKGAEEEKHKRLTEGKRGHLGLPEPGKLGWG